MKKSHILLVDDELSIRFTFHVALETGGYSVDLARSPQEAVERVTLRGFDLIILDLRLGSESGLDLLADFREMGVQTPVLMITAYGTATDAVAAMKLGAMDFLHKPLEPQQLRDAVADILKRASAKSEGADTSAADTCEGHVLEAKHAINCRDFGAARNHLAESLRLDDQSADAHYLLGVLFELQDNPDTARRYYRRALDLYAGHSLATSQLKRLERTTASPSVAT